MTVRLKPATGIRRTMERYHILKLGLAITFYAAYCIRPMLVYSLEADNKLDNNRSPDLDFFQYFQGVDGRPGIDYPVYSYIPRTAFSCRGIESGYYADLQTDCQVFHICEDGRKISFLCPNGTIFQQADLICEWWNKVNCSNSPSLYEESAERLQNDIARRKASRKVNSFNSDSTHGAVMRTEERSTVRASKNGRDYPVRHQQKTRSRIPDNNDIEHQIQQTESNNRHLANVPQQANRYQNHNYNNIQLEPRQTKKDVDRSTGNFVSTYDRSSKRLENSPKNSFNFGSKTDTLKEYYQQSTSSAIETEIRTTEKYNNNQYQRSNHLTGSYDTSSTLRPMSYSTFTTMTPSFTTPINFNAEISSTTTVQPINTTLDPFRYGISLKNRFKSYDAKKLISKSTKDTVKYQRDNTPVTTYSPLVKYSTNLSQIPVQVNQISSNTQNKESEETQIPQESSSFVKSPYNSITDDIKSSTSYPNHRSTYSDIKQYNFLEAPKISSISSITPHLITTQSINSGKPFVGSRVGSTVKSNQPTTQSKYTYLPTTTPTTVIFGVLRHSTEPSPFGPPELFNAGSTDKMFSTVEVTTDLINQVPTELFNVGKTDTTLKSNAFPTTTVPPLKIYVPEDGSLNTEPVDEPPFIKKSVPLLYSTTEKPSDEATVYGSYSSSTVGTRTSKSFNQGVPIKFQKGQDKISIHLSKNVGGNTKNQKYYGSAIQPPLLKVGAVVHVQDVQSFSSTAVPKSKTEKPRPFAKSLNFDDTFDQGKKTPGVITSTFPNYHISSARPFGINDATQSTPSTTFGSSIHDNVDNMIGVLQEIANFNSQQKEQDDKSSLVIPPSVSPQTLHSLAQYFASELQNQTDNEVLEPDTKEKITELLSAMTVHGYNNLFNVGYTATPTASTSSPITEPIETATKSGGNDESDQDDLLSTTSLPELRQLARNFSLALSSYLHDPENFRKSLESLRPTEPPSLDNPESSTTEDELLNFSDAEARPSTPSTLPSATWGYILSAEENNDVKNSLNPDLNTADSQSFIPRFNNLQVNENKKSSSELPPNHWTTSEQATQLWQKALSVNPAIVNDNLEATSSSALSLPEEIKEPELFNPEVLSTSVSIEPLSEISYDLRALPPLELNSTQVHGILIDFMNHTKLDENSRLSRVLKKLNTSEDEFLDRMKEIESNPLTKRLILLLISECGANISQELGLESRVSGSTETTTSEKRQNRENHYHGTLLHPDLKEDDQDTRALQLLNSLYTIASRFGRKR